jgi:hypothetical protein
VTTPAEYRALADRVMAGGGSNSEIAMAIGWTRVDTNWHGTIMRNPEGFADYIPDFLDDLNAVATLEAHLRKRGWLFAISMRTDGMLLGAAYCRRLKVIENTTAPTECAARVALALLCLVAKGEAGE